MLKAFMLGAVLYPLAAFAITAIVAGFVYGGGWLAIVLEENEQVGQILGGVAVIVLIGGILGAASRRHAGL